MGFGGNGATSTFGSLFVRKGQTLAIISTQSVPSATLYGRASLSAVVLYAR